MAAGPPGELAGLDGSLGLDGRLDGHAGLEVDEIAEAVVSGERRPVVLDVLSLGGLRDGLEDPADGRRDVVAAHRLADGGRLVGTQDSELDLGGRASGIGHGQTPRFVASPGRSGVTGSRLLKGSRERRPNASLQPRRGDYGAGAALDGSATAPGPDDRDVRDRTPPNGCVARGSAARGGGQAASVPVYAIVVRLASFWNWAGTHHFRK